MVPVHEIAGEVIAVGDGVTKYKIGDRVGVGWMVDSLQELPVMQGWWWLLPLWLVMTYNGKAKHQPLEEYNEEGGPPTYGPMADICKSS